MSHFFRDPTNTFSLCSVRFLHRHQAPVLLTFAFIQNNSLLIIMVDPLTLKIPLSVNSSKKRKRRKLPPQERRRRRNKFEKEKQIALYRNGVRRNRLVQAASKLSYMSDAIHASENLILTLANDARNKMLVNDISRDIKIMKGRALRLELQYESAKGLSPSKRCSRKRNKTQRTTDKYVQNLIGRRRKNRHLIMSKGNSQVPSSNKADTELSEILSDSDSDSDVSIDSEAEDETYVPEIISRRGKSRNRRTHCKRGNNEESLADKDDVFAEEYECLNEKYQFAIDLKNKDLHPGK